MYIGSSMKMDAAGSFETVHAYQTARDYVQEDSNLHSHRRQQVKSVPTRGRNENVRTPHWSTHHTRFFL